MDRLNEIIEQIDQQKQPPVHLWDPSHVGEIDIKIDVSGNWFHEGSPIRRDELSRLFASILWYQDEQHFLVTPVERLAIEVVDVPYIIHQMEKVGDVWVAITNTHEQVIIGDEHRVELRRFGEQWVPYVNVRYELWARINRSIYVQWVNEALEKQGAGDEEGTRLMLSSSNYSFEVARLD